MKKQSGFEKFHKEGGPKKGAALKEQFRQEKKKITKERKEYFENQRREKAVSREIEQPKGLTVKKAIERKITDDAMPLNKYLAHSGVCGRREAA
ncbi:MAG: pseudouridine synthase, partial [Flaviaesturariibacter sp.]|nr:pseudouridine synthase [Flaviaesturariibacter sp.]